jgi:CubicO group peptidase (beta-lactamase class C family)
VKHGWVVAERYAVGITPMMPLIGWSMTERLTHALIGIGLKHGELKLSEPLLLPEWRTNKDVQQIITLDHLLRMNSGLAFDERTRSLNS